MRLRHWSPLNRMWWTLNGWRDIPDWLVYDMWARLKDRLSIWWFWYSPPWASRRRCPACAGDGVESRGYGDVSTCGTCGGTGKVWK